MPQKRARINGATLPPGFISDKTADVGAGLFAILTAMGSLSYGEKAGERMRLA